MDRSYQPAIGLPLPIRRLVAAPQLKLILATLFWGGNVLVGRAIHDDMTPISATHRRRRCRSFSSEIP